MNSHLQQQSPAPRLRDHPGAAACTSLGALVLKLPVLLLLRLLLRPDLLLRALMLWRWSGVCLLLVVGYSC